MKAYWSGKRAHSAFSTACFFNYLSFYIVYQVAKLFLIWRNQCHKCIYQLQVELGAGVALKPF
jgi:hypothetical protein